MTAPRFIRLHAFTPPILTWQEFEKLRNEVTALAVADPDSMIPRVLARQLLDHEGTYIQAKARDHVETCTRCQPLRTEHHRLGYPCPDCGALCGCDWHTQSTD